MHRLRCNTLLAELEICARQTRFKRARGRTSLGAEKWMDTPLHAGTAAAVAALRASGFSIAAAQVLCSLISLLNIQQGKATGQCRRFKAACELNTCRFKAGTCMHQI